MSDYLQRSSIPPESYIELVERAIKETITRYNRLLGYKGKKIKNVYIEIGAEISVEVTYEDKN